jgi:UDP-glucose 4-epimerase
MTRVLITGGSGFIGGYLVAQALEKGFDVTVALRPNSDKTRLSDPRLRLLYLPLHDLAAMTDLLRSTAPFDWVIHNAGVTKALSKQGYIEGNTENTRRLVQALQQADRVPTMFLMVSSLAALGSAPTGKEWITAEGPPSPLTPYADSKHKAEVFLESLPPDFPWIVVQPTAVYGPWERDILTVVRLASKGLALTIGLKSQKLSFVHGSDVAKAIFHILQHPKTQLRQKFILSDGQAYTTEDLVDAISGALGRKKTLRVRLPLFVVKPIAWIAETVGRWQNKPAALNRDKIPELTAENWHCDASPLLDTLGFRPEFDLYSGMQDTVNWYRQQGWL